jgi:hypothetical protein
MLSRRLFLNGLLIGAAAPAIVRADSIMKIVVPSQNIIVPNSASWSGFADMNGRVWPPDVKLAIAVWSKHIGDEIARGQRNSFARRFLA